MLKWIRAWFGGREQTATAPGNVVHSEPIKTTTSVAGDIKSPQPETHYITAAEVKEKMERGDSFKLVDVREPQEVAIAAIPGAVHIPMGDIHARYQELGENQNQEIIVFCHHGTRSEMVMHQLWGLGYQNTKNLVGGIDAWSLDVDPKVARY
jgi:adenylyltransferase/sulfurtransferase